MSGSVTLQTKGQHDASANVLRLNHLAIRGLAEMFDSEKQLFCFRVKKTGDHQVREGFSRRYTMMSLLGLEQAERNGLQSPINGKAVLGGLLQQTDWIKNLGDLGLLLWLCAFTAPERLKQTCVDLLAADALARYPEGREGRTMEVAWYLTGLAHAALVSAELRSDLTGAALRTYDAMARNQGRHGIFGHQYTDRTIRGLLRGRVGSFADQVYPIYALTRFAQAFEIPSALAEARACADAICRTQGPLGQWWWHYNSASGRVMQRYPVYAVHQDGMAPMALFASGEATDTDYTGFIYKGLAWITGENELGSNLEDTSSGAIWRCIYRQRAWRKYGDEVREWFGSGRFATEPSDLTTLLECRPYHLGWLLYAFAGRHLQ